MTTPIGTADFVPATASTPQDQLIISAGSTVVAAGTTVDLGATTITAPGYTLYADVLFPSAATVPFLGINVMWEDPVTGLLLATEQYVIAGTDSAPAGSSIQYYGRGPTKTAQVDVQIQNYDPAQSATADFYLWQGDRVVTRDDFRNRAMNNTVPGYNVPSNATIGLLLAREVGVTLAENVSKSWLLPSFAGTCNLMISGSIDGWGWQLQSVVPALGATAASWPLLFPPQTSLPEDAQFEAGLILPRYPSLLTVNNTGSASLTYSFTLAILEYAS